MKSAVLFIAKLLLKTCIGVLLACLYAINFIIAICCVTVRYAALPIMFVAAVIAMTTYSDEGLTLDVLDCIFAFAAAGAFYFALPQVPKLLAFVQGFLSGAFHAITLTVSSPVKYRFD